MKKPSFVSFISIWSFIVIFGFYTKIVRSLNLTKGGSISITPETTNEEYYRLFISLLCLVGFIFIIYHVINFYRLKIKSYKTLRILVILAIISQIINVVLTFLKLNQITLLFLPFIIIAINIYILYYLFLPSTFQKYQECAEQSAMSKRMIK